jgi:glycosyltransferase involved in cell wall biosynthesis
LAEPGAADIGTKIASGTLAKDYATVACNSVELGRMYQRFYPDLDLAVVPTHSDGLAYSVVEPLLAGVPVVATNAGGIPDLIRDGDTGWLVPPGNPTALASAMCEALDDPLEARRRAVEGTQLARNLMDLRKTGEEVALTYENILAHKIN